MISLTIAKDEAGMRLDRLVRKKLALTSLGAIYRLLRQGGVRVNGRRSDGAYRLVEGDTVRISVADAELVTNDAGPRDAVRKLAETEFFRRNFRVIFEDECLLACDKPGNLVVHSGTGHQGHDTLIDLARGYMLTKSATGHPEPVLVHRIDKDTSGVILLAKDMPTVRALHAIFRSRGVVKRYSAVCHGAFAAAHGTIDERLVRIGDSHAGMKMRVGSEGVPARSSYRVLACRGGITAVDVTLHTGRTHQIRVHLAHLGHPVVGDERYGNRDEDDRLFATAAIRRRLYLHAHLLSFPHPVTGATMTITAPRPPEFAALLRGGGGLADS